MMLRRRIDRIAGNNQRKQPRTAQHIARLRDGDGTLATPGIATVVEQSIVGDTRRALPLIELRMTHHRSHIHTLCAKIGTRTERRTLNNQYMLATTIYAHGNRHTKPCGGVSHVEKLGNSHPDLIGIDKRRKTQKLRRRLAKQREMVLDVMGTAMQRMYALHDIRQVGT